MNFGREKKKNTWNVSDLHDSAPNKKLKFFTLKYVSLSTRVARLLRRIVYVFICYDISYIERVTVICHIYSPCIL